MKIFIKIIIVLTLIFVFFSSKVFSQEKIKIGLLIPTSGPDSEIGNSIIKSIRLATNRINNPLLEIVPKNTESDPTITFEKAKQLRDEGIKIVIGPVFNKNLKYLDELNDIIFLSLTNKMIANPKNIISAGINASSQFKTISKFQKLNDIKKTIFLIPRDNYKEEIEIAIKQSKIKTKNIYYYDSEPTKLTKQIEKITKYPQRKRNLERRIKNLEKSEEENKDNKIEKLKKKDTLGKVNFDSIVISDFDERLKSVTTSLVYTDISPKKFYFITLNQWFDKSLLYETTSQPIYFPSINNKNYNEFKKKYKEIYNERPNELSFLSYDLIGLVYYLIIKNKFIIDEKMFVKENKFKGKIGIFEIKKK